MTERIKNDVSYFWLCVHKFFVYAIKRQTYPLQIQYTRKEWIERIKMVEPYRTALGMEIQYSVFHFWLNCWILCKQQYRNAHEISYYLWLVIPKQSTHNTHVDYYHYHIFYTKFQRKQSQIINRFAKSFSFSPVFDMSNELVSTTAHTTSHTT